MNVLVFILSTTTRNDKIIYKDPDGNPFEGIQTNEAAAKYLINKLSDSDEKLGKIIAVTSQEADANGKQRFIDGINEFCGGKFDIKNIKFVNKFSDNGDLPPEKVLDNVLKEISLEDTVYLDVSGGKRTDVNMMLLLMKLVRYKGIKIADAFYSDAYYRTISSHSDFYRNLDILDGVNQFVTTGNALQLAECYSSISEDSPVKKLLSAMVDFSDSVNLCSLSGIENTLADMNDLITMISDSTDGGMDMFLFREIIPIIKRKFFGDSGKPDYCQIILWCLDNRLIQQAVTMYVEKIPKYLLDKGFLSYTEELLNKKPKPGESSIERELFFTNLMSCDGVPAEEKAAKKKVEELRRSLTDSDYTSEDSDVVTAKKAVLTFKRKSKNQNNYRDAANDLQHDSDTKIVIIAKMILKMNKMNNIPKIDGLLNVVGNNEPLLRELLGLPPTKSQSSDKSTITKINTIRNINEDTIFPEGITVNISCSDLKAVMTDYLYARQMRNRINHATDSTDMQKVEEFFAEKQIDYSFNMTSIMNQLRKSVEFILDLQNKLN